MTSGEGSPDKRIGAGAGASRSRPARVLVFGGPRDGAGRTTLVTHLAVALLRMGRATGVVDLNLADRSLSRWLARRRTQGEGLVMPAAPTPSASASPPAREALHAEAAEIARLAAVLAALGETCDAILIDAPSGGGALAAAAHAHAGGAIAVVADGAQDLLQLFEIDEDGRETGRPGAYGRAVWEERRKRGLRHEAPLDWMLVRSRVLARDPARGRALDEEFARAERLLGARRGPRLWERPGWRLGGEDGLTALDPPLLASAEAQDMAQDLRDLVIALKLPGLEGVALGF